MGKLKDGRAGGKPERLALWQGRLSRCKMAYDDELLRCREREAIYAGTREVDGVGGYLGGGRSVSSVYNIAYELIEGQVDSNVPAPLISAVCSEDVPLAGEVEDMLRTKLEELPFEVFNDMDERNTYNQGGSYAYVEWDNGVRRHDGVGDVSVTSLHPVQVIPQEGVLEVEDMDYLFIRQSATRAAVKKRYGMEVGGKSAGQKKGEERAGDIAPYEEDASVRGGDGAAQDLLTVNTVFFKNGEGGIGRYVWANDTELESLEDYEARWVRRCKKCGAPAALGEGECPACGGKKFETVREDYEELEVPVQRSDGSEIPAEEPVTGEDGMPLEEVETNPGGSPRLDELGRPVVMPKMRKVRIPHYKPRCFPVVLRRNVSRFGALLGSSDIDVIRPQQDAVKKLTQSILEKLLKGGSYVTLPAGVKIETNERQLKVLRIENPAQKQLIDVLTIQPNISFDMAAMNDQYERARSALGITNSYQGKPDSTATSGVAKQFAATQTAGRMESKRRMKSAYYEKLFKLMFKFMLAYADGPVKFRAFDEKGNEIYTQFNRYDFLKQDEAGEWYWNDEFLFSVDVTGGLSHNRETMWMEAERKYVSGAMGDPTSDDTRLVYWTLLEQLQFPLAKAVKRSILEAREKAGAAGGAPGMPGMPGGGAGAMAAAMGGVPGGAALGGMPGGDAGTVPAAMGGAPGEAAPGGISGGNDVGALPAALGGDALSGGPGLEALPGTLSGGGEGPPLTEEEIGELIAALQAAKGGV